MSFSVLIFLDLDVTSKALEKLNILSFVFQLNILNGRLVQLQLTDFHGFC